MVIANVIKLFIPEVETVDIFIGKREGTDWTRRHGLVWNEESHHWLAPGLDNETEEISTAVQRGAMDAKASYMGDKYFDALNHLYNIKRETYNKGVQPSVDKFVDGLIQRVRSRQDKYHAYLRRQGESFSERGFGRDALTTVSEDVENYSAQWSNAYVDYVTDKVVNKYVFSSYRDINKWLRRDPTLSRADDGVHQERDARIRDDIEHLTSIMSPLRDQMVLYRGIAHREKFQMTWSEGDVLVNPAFMSTSRDPDTAVNFTGDLMFEIHSSMDTKGIVLESHEFETILGLNQMFKVKKIYKDVDFGYKKLPYYVVLEPVQNVDEDENVISMSKAGEPTDWTREHGLVYDEPSHHWKVPHEGLSEEDIGNLEDGIQDALKSYSNGDYDATLHILDAVYDDIKYMDHDSKEQRDKLIDWITRVSQQVHNTRDDAVGNLRDVEGGLSRRGFTRPGWESVKEDHEDLEDYVMESNAYVDHFEYELLEDYLESGYEYVNDWLRGKGVHPEYEDDVRQAIMDITRLMQPLQDPQPVYRGIRNILNTMFEHAQVGDIVANEAFMSTSRSPEIALNFAYDTGITNEAIIEIYTQPDTQGIVVSTDESETILGLNQQFRIKEIHKNVHLDKTHMQNYFVIEALPVEKHKPVVARKSTDVYKAPPGPPPAPHLKWKEETSRWVLPDNSKFVGTKGHVQAVGLMSQAKDAFHNRDYTEAISQLSELWLLGIQAGHDYGDEIAERAQSLIEHIYEREEQSKAALESTGGISISQLGYNEEGWDIAHEKAVSFDTWTAPSYQPYDTEEIESYTGAGYASMNTILRGLWKEGDHDPANTRMYAERIGKLRSMMTAIKETQVLYRGVSGIHDTILNQLKVGETFIAEGFVSTSRDPDVAYNFTTKPGSDTRNQDHIFLEIHTGEGAKAITIDSEEHETILDTSQSFRVKEIKANVVIGNKEISRYVVIEYVGEDMELDKIKSRTIGILQAAIVKAPQGTDWTKKHGLEFDDDIHRWIQPERDSLSIPMYKWDKRVRAVKAEDITELANYVDINKKNTMAKRILYLYTRDGYKYINNALKYAPDDAKKDNYGMMIRHIEETMKPIGKPMTAYRGMPFRLTKSGEDYRGDDSDLVTIGDVMSIDTFMSVSRNPDVAANFAFGKGKGQDKIWGDDEDRYDEYGDEITMGADDMSETFIEVQLSPDVMSVSLPNSVDEYEEFETILSIGQSMEIMDIKYNVRTPHGLIRTYIVVKVVYSSSSANDGLQLSKATRLFKGPPGERPEKFAEDVYWNEPTSRWRKPKPSKGMNIPLSASVTPGLVRKLDPKHSEGLNILMDFLKTYKAPVYLFGGTIRDLFRGTTPKDLDFRVGGDSDEFITKFEEFLGENYIGTHRDTMINEVHFNTSVGDLKMDFVPYATKTIEEDLRTRDFSINAMGIAIGDLGHADWHRYVLDPTNGLSDMQDKVIRQLRDDSMEDDPMRIMRAFRFATQLGYKIDTDTYVGMLNNIEGLRQQSGRRIRNETMKILALSNSVEAVRNMDELGILDAILPELTRGRDMEQPPNYHYYDVLEHQFQALKSIQPLLDGKIDTPIIHEYKDYFDEEVGEGYTRRDLLLAATLLHDVGKPDTQNVGDKGQITFYEHEHVGGDIIEDVAQRLKFDRRSKNFMEEVVRHHMRPWKMAKDGEMPTPKAVRNFAQKAGDVAPAVLLLNMADLIAARGPNLDDKEWQYRMDFMTHTLELLKKQGDIGKQPKLLTGHDLIGMGIPQDSMMGKLLRTVHEAQMRGEITTRDEAVDMIDRLREKPELLEKAVSLFKREKPPMAEKYGWEWDEQRHHWVVPATKPRSEKNKKMVVNVTDLVQNAAEHFRAGNYDKAVGVLEEASRKTLFNDTAMASKLFSFLLDLTDHVKKSHKKSAKQVVPDDKDADKGMLARGASEQSWDEVVDIAAEIEATDFNAYISDHSDSWQAFEEYTGEEYSLINDGLRDGIPLSEEHVHIVKTMIGAMKPLGRKAVLYRGIKSHDLDQFLKAKKGSILNSPAFTSTSFNPETAFEFSDGGQMILEIHAPAIAQGAVLPNNASGLAEQELIFDVNTTFRVRTVKKNVDFGHTLVDKYMVLEIVESDSHKTVSKAMTISKTPQGTEWTRKHGLDWSEEKHRWILPDLPELNPDTKPIFEAAVKAYKEGRYADTVKWFEQIKFLNAMAYDDTRVKLNIFIGNLHGRVLELLKKKREALKNRRGISAKGMDLEAWNSATNDWRETEEKKFKAGELKRVNGVYARYTASEYMPINDYLRKEPVVAELPRDIPDNIRKLVGNTKGQYTKLVIIDQLESKLTEVLTAYDSGDYLEANDKANDMWGIIWIDHLADYLGDYVGSILNPVKKKLTAQRISEMSESMYALPENVVYRGLGKKETPFENLQVGEYVEIDSFMSTSRNPHTAHGFNGRNTMLEIRIGDDIRGIELDTHEYETVIEYAQHFKVLEHYQNVRFGSKSTDDFYVLEYAPVSEIPEDAVVKKMNTAAGLFVQKYVTDGEIMGILRTICDMFRLKYSRSDSAYKLATMIRSKGGWHVASRDFRLAIDDINRKVVSLENLAYQQAPHLRFY